LDLLRKKIPSVSFLQSRESTSNRYKYKNVILFSFRDTRGENVLKFYSIQHLDEPNRVSEIQDIYREFHTARGFFKHSNFIRVYDLFELKSNNEILGFCITMERFPLTLSQYLIQRRQLNQPFSPVEIRDFLNQVGKALETAHYKLKEPIVHADVKPANIGIRFIGNSIQYVLMDFDISVRLYRSYPSGRGDDSLSNVASQKGLTPDYAAPEQIVASLNGTSHISNRIDIYSLGVIGLQMYTGIAPFRKEQDVFFQLPLNHVTSSSWRSLFNQLCHPDPKKRPKRIVNLSSSGRLRTINPSAGIKGIKKRNPLLLYTIFIVAGLILATLFLTAVIIYSESDKSGPVQPQLDEKKIINENSNNTSIKLVTMPFVILLSLDDAMKRIEEEGLQVGRVDYMNFHPNYSGRVLYTSIKYYDVVPMGTYVDLIICN
jgi:serine/threonine protein kinase